METRIRQADTNKDTTAEFGQESPFWEVIKSLSREAKRINEGEGIEQTRRATEEKRERENRRIEGKELSDATGVRTVSDSGSPEGQSDETLAGQGAIVVTPEPQ
jgi:hypothetical protein